eukprot:m.120831 g.120831  ORF g.120831 m.120831 type:complete len:449 (+) comp9283_c0_seq8:115-1461(+)
MDGLIDELLDKAAQVTPTIEWAEYTALYDLVQRIRNEQDGTSLSPLLTGQKDFSKFNAWFEAVGGHVEKVEIAPFADSGNGLRAREPIKKGEAILHVPLQAMITSQAAIDSDMGIWAKQEQMLMRMPNVLLALFLVRELNNRASPWAEYIKVLPSAYDLPLCWTPADLATLKGTSAYTAALALFKHVARQYAYLHRALRNPSVADLAVASHSFTFDDYRWAVCTVMSRQNRIPIGGTDEHPEFALALIPYWDLLNHAAGSITTVHDCATHQTEFTAMEDVPQGQQVTMYYGQRSLSDFVLHSGFLPSGPDTHMRTHVGLARADALFQQKAAILARINLPNAGDYRLAAGDVDPALIAFARVSSAPKEELEHLAGLNDDLLYELLIRSPAPDVDKRARAFVATRCSILSAQAPPAVETGANMRQKLALSLRHAERDIILSCVQALKAAA